VGDQAVARYLVVGSGATGVHVAQTLVERGESVELVDVGFERPPARHPDADFSALKELEDADAGWFLGEAGRSVVYPAPASKPYGFPPDKDYVFRRPAAIRIEERGFAPLVSFARGGLAEAWTGGSYELRDEELADFPFAPHELRPHYATVAARIGVTGERDDLAEFSPLTAGYQQVLPLDAHSGWLLARYRKRPAALRSGNFVLGRSRVAVLSSDLGDRRRCSQLGRCLWGCPRGALYAPSHTLARLQVLPGFTYRPGLVVRRVLVGGGGEAVGVAVVPVGGGSEIEIRSERVILAAGALATTQIYLQTLAAQGRERTELPGLMDNRQVTLPFLSPGLVGSEVQLASYQFHMLALAVRTGNWRTDVHGQVSTLKAAAVHPIVATLPFDLRTSLRVFRRLRAGLGVANIWLADSRRDENRARLAADPDGVARLVLEYAGDDHDLAATRAAIEATRRGLGALGCLVPSGMTRILPRGSSVHYAGTLPMSRAEAEHTTGADGAVRGFRGLHVADGAGFPWLPAKNLTFTLMANATRIASAIE
jgi:choline dehydrogenase-like flavoprotein